MRKQVFCMVDDFLFKKSRGQAMTEYIALTAMLVIGLWVQESNIHLFEKMTRAFTSYLEGIMFVLNFPLPC